MRDELRDRRIKRQAEAARTKIRAQVGAAIGSANVRAQLELAEQLQLDAMTIAAGEERIREILPPAALERLTVDFEQSARTSDLQLEAVAVLYESAGVGSPV